MHSRTLSYCFKMNMIQLCSAGLHFCCYCILSFYQTGFILYTQLVEDKMKFLYSFFTGKIGLNILFGLSPISPSPFASRSASVNFLLEKKYRLID